MKEQNMISVVVKKDKPKGIDKINKLYRTEKNNNLKIRLNNWIN